MGINGIGASGYPVTGYTARKAERGAGSGATEQVLYDLDHPKAYVPKSIEVQQAQIKEREFYVAFLEKLEKL